MKRRGSPEADLQRSVATALKFALPKTAIIHHCANEVTEPGPRGAKRQAILVGMGVHPGFPDLVVLSGGRVLFFELKSPSGRLGPAQAAFRDAVPGGAGLRRLTTVERMLRRGRKVLERVARHPAVVGYVWRQWLDEPGEQPPFARGLVHHNGTEAREHTELLTAFNLRAETLRRTPAAKSLSS